MVAEVSVVFFQNQGCVVFCSAAVDCAWHMVARDGFSADTWNFSSKRRFPGVSWMATHTSIQVLIALMQRAFNAFCGSGRFVGIPFVVELAQCKIDRKNCFAVLCVVVSPGVVIQGAFLHSQRKHRSSGRFVPFANLDRFINNTFLLCSEVSRGGSRWVIICSST